jgi:DNA-binding transcriptional LysR family regulator
MHVPQIDLNLLRLLDAVYRTGSVSRAAEQLGVTQPAASQGLARLRRLLNDALFVRAGGAMAATPRAERLAGAVRQALSTLEQALAESPGFDPVASRRTFRLHLSDIGEARFLPGLMAVLKREAPQVRLETSALPHAAITRALDDGGIDLAIGFLPGVRDVRSVRLLEDRYIVLLRDGHPFARRARRTASLEDLRKLEFAAVRTHAETLRILHLLKLDDRLRLTADHFLALPSIVRETDLAVLMPRDIALRFARAGEHRIVESRLPRRDFAVSMHWSHRFDADPALRWLRERTTALFGKA